MDKIKNILNKLWKTYKNWLGDIAWYKNWKVWLSVGIIIVLTVIGDVQNKEEKAIAEEQRIQQEEQIEKEEKELEKKIQEEQERKQAKLEEQEKAEQEEIERVENLTTEEKIKEISEKVFGSSLIDFEYIEDNDYYKIYSETSGISVNMDKNGTQYDISNLLEEIQDLDFKNIYVEYQAEFVDSYGNSEKREGIFYEFSKETVDKINFDNFLPEKLPDIADQYWEHPAFE